MTNNKMKKKTTTYLLFGCLTLSVCSSCIYDDLSHCGNLHTLSYSIIDNTTTARDVIREELTAPGTEPMAQELERVLLPMFSDQAHRLSLGFYLTEGSLHAKTGLNPEGNHHTLQMQLPPVAHEHIALAHNAEAYPVELRGIEDADELSFFYNTLPADTTQTEMTGVFMGHALLPAEASTDTICLTMQNTAAAIVLTPLSGTPLGEAAMYVRETAMGCACSDSLFLFDGSPVLRGLRTDAGGLTAFYSAAFPSRDESAAAAAPDKGLWEVDIYIRMDKEITKNTLHIDRPLRAGIPQVLSFTVDDRGEIAPSQDVTVSVELDWNPGFDFDLEL